MIWVVGRQLQAHLHKVRFHEAPAALLVACVEGKLIMCPSLYMDRSQSSTRSGTQVTSRRTHDGDGQPERTANTSSRELMQYVIAT